MSRWIFKDGHRFTYPVSVTVEVDDASFTEEIAQQVNSFWTGADERLATADGDEKRAALLMVAAECIGLAVEYGDRLALSGLQRQFDEAEGFPPNTFKLISVESLDEIDLDEIEVIQEGA